MENYQPTAERSASAATTLKESIRDMIRVQASYHLSDELFWEIFNARVLLNKKIDINALLGNPGRRAC